MSRPLIEFIQSQVLAWKPAAEGIGGEGAQMKILSQGAATGEVTALVRYPPGYREAGDAAQDQEEEMFVLQGELTLDGVTHSVHSYAYFPEYNRPQAISSTAGALILRFLGPRASAPSPHKKPIAQLDTTAMRWDGSNIDPEVNHLYTFRKNLRLAEDGRCRTYLLAGLPQGFPPSGLGRLERHPHVEEFFFVYGDMSCTAGVMRAGAYCWRPPMVWHGLDCSRSGFLIFFRSPGANVNLNLWAEDQTPIVWNPKHAPELPSDLLAISAEPLPDPISY